ncbi:hypothetical protein BJ170DRAFT_279459 [Xylariales sp. AK1849]|nr:hypothetical protein BJ170DRAFT_279459 [Xylariales sp. AK1849]
MAIPGPSQALIAAFTFGILFNAASAGFVLYIKGHGSAIFRDSLRLALILFLASSALWAQVEFLTTIINTTATSTCQVAVIFSTLFDQFARVSIEQYLLWAVAKQGKKTVLSILPQLLLLARFVVGMVFVGESRVQFNPTCVPLSSVVPLAIVVVVLDAVILAIIAIQAFTSSSSKDGQGNGKAVLLTIGALAIWMGTSLTLLLGLSTIDLLYRTAVPASGLSILVALVTIFSGSLAVPRERRPRLPDSPTPQNMNRDRDLSTADSNEYPPTRYEDVKGPNTMTVTAYSGRELPRRDKNDLPTITRPVTGVTGIGGAPVQGQLFPPMRLDTVDSSTISQVQVKTRIEKPKRSKNPAAGNTTVGKLAISNPIVMNSPDTQNAFNKIPTVDLATAARNERERRDGYAQRVSMLIANRPAPQPPTKSSEEGLKSAVSTRRKEVPSPPSPELIRSNSVKTSQTGGNLSVEGNASSSSAQLSPGNEELRRRSPRQVMPSSVPTKTPTFQPVTPGQPIRIPIPRPPPPPEPVIPEPVKTPLQRRPTTGLPSNPRAQAMKKMAEETTKSRQQTVMFINNIVYDDPTAVNSIIQGASKTPYSPLKSSNSVVNRPRPIPRKGEKDRQVFPAEVSPSPGHRRTKSGGSITVRRSILQSTPGSPTQLPPLPPPPQSAGNVLRPQPNDTKSMTFDEKMTMFFPAPPGGPLSVSSAITSTKQRASIPELPPLPAAYLEAKGSPVIEQPSEIEVSRRLTKTTATDRSSIRTRSILGVEQLSQRYLRDDSQNIADELGNSWLPGISTSYGIDNQQAFDGPNRKSSPVIPAVRYSVMSEMSEAKTRDEEATTNWGSVHSPVAPVDIHGSRLNARSTYIQKESRLPSVMSGFGDEVMTIMLDTTSEKSTKNRQSFYDDDDASDYGDAEAVKRGSSQWHHRVGDDCPTFSDRRQKVRSRKMPPPTPLLLQTSRNKKAVVIQTAEPSPLESPQAAYKLIQAQLSKLDEASRDSIGSEGKRIALLENLEAEMGQVESKWQTMQHNLDRDSLSTIQTDSRPTSTVNTVSRSSSTKSMLAERRASRRSRTRSASRSGEDLGSARSTRSSESSRSNHWQARLAEAQMEYLDHAPDLIMKRNNLNFLSVAKADLGSPTPPDTDESDAETEARFRSLTAQISRPTVKAHQLWRVKLPKNASKHNALWEAPIGTQESSNAVELPGLSVRPCARKCLEPLTIQSSHLWQKRFEPAKPRLDHGLWTKTLPKQQPKEVQELQPVLTRPLTQRPARRNKRVTLLPDILENPEPLPDKRDTLGIFQFPWGEKSEHATIQSRPSKMFMAMPGTMTSGGPRINAALEARSRQLEADEYSSSFFDDYDEEDGDNFDDSDGDDFDETTLWEIASLLKSEQVPSKNSLLPLPLGSSVIDEYIAEVPSEDEADEEYVDEIDFASEELVPSFPPVPISSYANTTKAVLWSPGTVTAETNQSYGLPQPERKIWESYVPSNDDVIRSQARIAEITPIESTKLWTPKSQQTSARPSMWIAGAAAHKSQERFGLPQPDLSIWATYIPVSMNLVRSPPRIKELPSIESSDLWVPTAKRMEASVAPLWAPAKPTSRSIAPSAASRIRDNTQLRKVSMMWEKPMSRVDTQGSGMFDVNCVRSDYRRTSEDPAAASMTMKPRSSKESLQQLAMPKLWKASFKSAATVSSKRPAMWSSPFVQATSSIGLFEVDPKRKVYRTTSAEPAALLMSTKPRKSDAPLHQLQTFGFWSANSSKKTEINWIKVSSNSSASASPVESRQSLFRVDPARKIYRTTSAEPAALHMVTRPRKIDAPLLQLQSIRLWSVNRTTTVVFDWITISSVRPQSPSVASVASTNSAPPSPLSDTLSTKTNSTKASSIAVSSSSGFSLGGWFGRKKKTAAEAHKIPEQTAIPEVPEVPEELNLRKFDTMSRELPARIPLRQQYRPTVTYYGDWEAALREAIVASYPGTRLALVHASEVQWENALQEAIKASHNASKTVRRTASPKEWSYALTRAIAASYPTNRFSRGQVLQAQWETELQDAIARSKRAKFDVSKCHPVFAGSSLVTKAQVVHPAATGYTQFIARSERAEFDVSKCHPVFAGSSLVTKAQVVHPAATGYTQFIARSERAEFDVSKCHPVFAGSSLATKAQVVHPAATGYTQIIAPLWSKPAASVSPLSKAMWTLSATAATRTEAPGLTQFDSELIRHQSQSTSTVAVDADFGRQGMWKHGAGMKRQDPRSNGRDWLDDSMKKRFSRIELRY